MVIIHTQTQKQDLKTIENGKNTRTVNKIQSSRTQERGKWKKHTLTHTDAERERERENYSTITTGGISFNVAFLIHGFMGMVPYPHPVHVCLNFLQIPT